MKTMKLLVLLALPITGTILNAQKPILVIEDTVSFKDSKYPGLVVTIPEFNYEKTQKDWIKELQSGTKSKVVTENKEFTILGANIKTISTDPINIYSKFLIQDSLLKLMAIFELGKEKYIDKASGENELSQARMFLKQFAKDQYVNHVDDELSSENKLLKELRNNLESLQDKKLKSQKSIQSNRTDSTELVGNIKIINSDIAKLTEEIIQENNQLAKMQPGAVKDEKTDYIKSIEKRKKKSFNEIESMQNKIVKLHSEIEQYQDDIVKNESGQEIMKGKITQQEAVVQKCTDKLATVKAF
jgi:peptidoglycan hydrolase CwlO-like protein